MLDDIPESARVRHWRAALRASFHDGNWSVFLTLALSLVVSFGGIGIIVAGALTSIVLSRFRIVLEALKLYVSVWLRSDAFALNLLVLLQTLIELGLVFYHGDDMAQFENQLKQYVTALAVLLTIRRFPVEVVFWGAAAACVLAAAMAFGEVVILDLARANGATNAIRFGMIAALMAIFSWVGALFGRLTRPARAFMAFAALAGIYAVFASGSRGAVVAIPIMLLMLVPRIWRWAGSAAAYIGIIFVLFSVALGLWQISKVRHNISGVQTLVSALLTGEHMEDQSARDRIVMLRLAARLFAENPWLGVGDRGWDRAVAEQRASNPDIALEFEFNQAHNQYANDFAKGGLARGLGGLALYGLPLFFFLRRHPFKLNRQSLAPLLGVVTCTAFAAFSLTESVMDLSLPASLYIVLVFYLTASAEGAPLSYAYTLQKSRGDPAGTGGRDKAGGEFS